MILHHYYRGVNVNSVISSSSFSSSFSLARTHRLFFVQSNSSFGTTNKKFSFSSVFFSSLLSLCNKNQKNPSYHHHHHHKSDENKRLIRTRRIIQGGGGGFTKMKNMNNNPNDEKDNEKEKKKILVFGSSGIVGSSLVQMLQKENYWILGVDIHAISASITAQSSKKENIKNTPDLFIQIPMEYTMNISTLSHYLKNQIQEKYTNSKEENPLLFEAIVCANGGFTMDSSSTRNSQDMECIYEDMMRKNFYPVVVAGDIAKEYMTGLHTQGLFVVMGAMSAFNGITPGMTAYGCSKAATHHYIQTIGSIMGKNKSTTLDTNNKNNFTVIGLLPTMIDTPNNRQSIPKANFDTWVKPNDISKQILSWIRIPTLRPHSGSLLKIIMMKKNKKKEDSHHHHPTLDSQQEYQAEFYLVR